MTTTKSTVETTCQVCRRPLEIRLQLWVLALPAAEREARIAQLRETAVHYSCQPN